MAKSDQSFGGPWTERKLKALRDYLNAYTTALKNQPFDLVYVDAFAGTGYRELVEKDEHRSFAAFVESDTEKFLDGSARRALEVSDRAFDRLVFIERSKEKCAELQNLRREHQDRRIEIIQDDANEALTAWCAKQDWRRQRAVLFLDPFATQVEWRTIETVARTRAIDTWILFPVGAVQRLLPHNQRPEEIDPKWQDRLNAIFGTEAWKEVFYRTSTEQGLFGDQERQRRIATAEVVMEYFIERLRGTFAGVADRYGMLHNSRGAPLFGFCFAAGNDNGARVAMPIVKHIVDRM